MRHVMCMTGCLLIRQTCKSLLFPNWAHKLRRCFFINRLVRRATQCSPARQCWVRVYYVYSPAGTAHEDLTSGTANQSSVDLCRPCGTIELKCAYPALTCWAKFCRPCGTKNL